MRPDVAEQRATHPSCRTVARSRCRHVSALLSRRRRQRPFIYLSTQQLSGGVHQVLEFSFTPITCLVLLFSWEVDERPHQEPLQAPPPARAAQRGVSACCTICTPPPLLCLCKLSPEWNGIRSKAAAAAVAAAAAAAATCLPPLLARE